MLCSDHVLMCTMCVLCRSEFAGQISMIYSVFQDRAEQLIEQNDLGISGILEEAEGMEGLVARHMYLKRELQNGNLQLSEAQGLLRDIEDEMVTTFVPAPRVPTSPTAGSR